MTLETNYFTKCSALIDRIGKYEHETESGDSSSDPHPNPCPICLGLVSGESYLDQCFHKFCYNCILHWTKVVASKSSHTPTSINCPVCKRANFSILHGCDGVSFHRHYVNQDATISLFFTKAHKYRLQLYYSVTDAFVDTANILRYWKLRKYLLGNNWSDQWIRREVQALTQEEDVEIIVHHITGVIDSFKRHEQKGSTATVESVRHGFKTIVSEAARPFLAGRTQKFVDELEMFLASGLNIGAYDKAYLKNLGWKVPGITDDKEEPVKHDAVVPNLCFLDEDSEY